MYEEPEESPAERPMDPATAAKEKADEFRVHAQLAAVFEACRKFDARILPGLDADLARDLQRSFARLEKSKSPESPVLPAESAADAARLLNLPTAGELSTNDYHIHRRPGEVMIARWLGGEEVETFYERFQAHFDVALEHFREEEKNNHGWKQNPKTLAYLAALDAINLKMADAYLRPLIRKHGIFVLSTHSADEMDILYLCDHIMGIAPAELVGPASAPPEDAPTEQDRAWYFKLFCLRGMSTADAGGERIEQMCFFAYLQKSEEGW